MTNKPYTVLTVLSRIVFIFLLVNSLLAVGQSATNETLPKNRISEEKFVLINGIEQWVTIKGDRTKPVILFVHGGPGSPMSPYSDHMYYAWEKDFMIVQWDQRGTGKTFGLHAPGELSPEYLKSNPLTLEQMTSDGIELTGYLLKHLHKQKIILFGTSWGSALGVKMVTERPEFFYAYVGHSQLVNPAINDEFYDRVYKIAEGKNDKEALEVLNTIGKPPYERARSVGQLFKIVKKYERQNSVPAPGFWFEESTAYDNPKDKQHRSDGDDYSFVNFAGDKKLGVQAMSDGIDLLKDNIEFKIPVYLIQGEEDILTPKESTKNYFNTLKAPRKEYYLLPKTAHGFNMSVLEAQYMIFKRVNAY